MRMVAERLQRAASGTIAWRVFPWAVRFAIRALELVVISCVVELAMTLPMALYFHRITIFALPVNLLILPLLVVLMPAALLTLLLLVVWPSAAVVPAMVVALVLHFGVRPGASVRLDGSRRFPHSRSAALAIGCVLRAAGGGDCAGAREPEGSGSVVAALAPGPRWCWRRLPPCCRGRSIGPTAQC